MTGGRPNASNLALRVLLALGLVAFPLLRPIVLTAPSVVSPAPAPVQEEEEKSEEKAGESTKSCLTARDRRQPTPSSAPRIQPHHTPDPRSGLALARSAPSDHFCNGLGTPFRC